jgi:hypothetical protein
MKPSNIAVDRSHSLAAIAAFMLFTAALAFPVPAQNPATAPNAVVTVDGAKTPELVPDWILWRELFRVAALLSEKSPDSGQSVWINRLHLSQTQMQALIAHGRSFKDEEAQMFLEAKAIATTGNGVISEAARGRLRQLQADNEWQALNYRDRLAEAIGDDAIRRMQSFARLNIAPGIRVIDFVPCKPPRNACAFLSKKSEE